MEQGHLKHISRSTIVQLRGLRHKLRVKTYAVL